MERHIDQELADLKKNLLRMGVLVQESIYESVEALKQLNADRASQLIASDRIIDDWENKIDEECLGLLALNQPVAGDLRFIAMSMKISGELERMADLAVDIAERTLELVGKPLLKPLVDIPKLAELAKEMTNSALEAFINKDLDLSGRVIVLDIQADQLRDLVQRELVNDYISKDATAAVRAVPLLLIARHLERICDHATNIAEDIIYMINAKVIKHHSEKIGK